MADLLYVDTSALLRRALGHSDSERVARLTRDVVERGGLLVSSRLLWLEVRRTLVRERLSGNDISGGVTEALAYISELRVTDQVWDAAHAIEAHIRTLDALHVATCLVAGAALLSFNQNMRSVARTLGVAVVDL
ncbi:MAG TPA: PIN domain-containing protein [Jatrophihabitans sp.]|jgi:hypothetical protein